MRIRWTLRKFFGLVTLTLVIIYFVAQWYLTENPGTTWIIPEIYIIVAAIITGILFIVMDKRLINRRLMKFALIPILLLLLVFATQYPSGTIYWGTATIEDIPDDECVSSQFIQEYDGSVETWDTMILSIPPMENVYIVMEVELDFCAKFAPGWGDSATVTITGPNDEEVWGAEYADFPVDEEEEIPLDDGEWTIEIDNGFPVDICYHITITVYGCEYGGSTEGGEKGPS